MTDYAPRKGMTAAEIDAMVEAILAEATLQEKATMMAGQGFFRQYAQSGKRWGANPYRAGSGCERLGVPALYFTDGPRGVARGHSTCFPCSMARGASFDTDLERRIGEIMGIEIRAQGCNLTGAVCVNLLRHPAWGRAQETYGEDPHHVGEMGAALAVGIQTHNVIATVKHFALNSMENARFKVNVACNDRTMREVYLPHFKRILDAGCASVMSAYNRWNGVYCGQHAELLTTILREEWGFEGFVHSDWVFGVREVTGAAAGLDIENPEPIVFAGLVEAVEQGRFEAGVLDTACRRILRTQYRFASAPDPLPAYGGERVACAAHVAVAREAAEKSAVLLRNEGVLPFDAGRVRTLAVLGRLAAMENTGDHGSSRVQPPHVVSVIEGLRAHSAGVELLEADEFDLARAAAVSARADAVLVVVGYTADDEGEYIPGGGIDLGVIDNPGLKAIAGSAGGMAAGVTRGGDRADLGLPAGQVALIRAAASSGKPVVVVIVAGSAVMVEDWINEVGAVLQTFYAGMEGGTALARLVFGDVSPSGRLPFTVARDAADYPFFDRDADAITYGPWHGYTLFEREGHTPRFGFGHGLSYARFSLHDVAVVPDGGGIQARVTVRNEGAMAADEVVLAFVHPPGLAADRPRRLLGGFARVTLAPGEAREVSVAVPARAMQWWDPSVRDWRTEAGEHRLEIVGRHGTLDVPFHPA